MFDSLKEAFRQARENFHAELNRDRIPEAADRLLRAMRDELTELQRELKKLELQLEGVEKEVAEEREAARTCLRREEMAREIGDTETAEVAQEFAAKHLRRQKILVEKASVLSRELADRKGTLAEMSDMYSEARLRGDWLVARARRAESRERIHEARDLFDEMDRIAARIEALAAEAENDPDVDETSDPNLVDEAAAEDLGTQSDAFKRRMKES